MKTHSPVDSFIRINPLKTAGFLEALMRQQHLVNCRCILTAIERGTLHLVETFSDSGDLALAWQLCDGSGRVIASTHMGGPLLRDGHGKAVRRVICGDLSWPLGLEKVPVGDAIALVRGADDFLAAHYIWSHCPDVSIVAMLGDVPIAVDAAKLFNGRSVVVADLRDPSLKRVFNLWRSQLVGVTGRLSRFIGGNGWNFSDGRPARSLSELAMVECETRVRASAARRAAKEGAELAEPNGV